MAMPAMPGPGHLITSFDCTISDFSDFLRIVIRRWVKKYRQSAKEDAEREKQIADMEELRRLQKEVEELRK